MTVDIVGTNTTFTQDVTTLGFGTSDVLVDQITVLSPTHMTAVVSPGATVASFAVTVTTGLEVISQALGSAVVATDPQL